MGIEWFWSSSILILLVVLMRFLFRGKIRPCMRYALWLIVTIRLLVPFSFAETAVSVQNLLPRHAITETVWDGAQTEQSNEPAEQSSVQVKKPEKANAKRNAEPALTEDGIKYEMESEADFGAVEAGQSEEPVVLADTIKTEEPVFYQTGRMRACQWLSYIWMSGAGMSGFLLLAANINYGRRLKRSRRRFAEELLPRKSAIPVYMSPLVQTPCLFGMFHPAVYVTEEVWEEEKLFEFVLCHENTHYIHKDHWWAFLRMVCFCLHWYNPFVWLAVYLSRQDGELACDEGVVERLEENQRIDYGNALLELSRMKDSGISGWQLSTTMRGSKFRLKERLWMIVDAPKKTKKMQILVCLLSVCLLVAAFTGGKAGSTSLAAGQTESIPVSEKETEPLEEALTEGAAEAEQLEDLPHEAEVYEKSIAFTLGEKEYQLLCEGYTTEEGLYNIAYIRLADLENSDSYVDVISTAEVSEAYWQGTENGPYPVCSAEKDGNILTVDLNFDGWNDLCFQGWVTGDGNIPYYCMLWNPQTQEFEYSAMLYNVEADVKNQWLSCKNGNGEQYSVTYFCYDTENKLHMLRYVEKALSEDAVFGQLDLTYVEDEGMYTLPAVVAKDRLTLTMIEMAKQALTELYQWTGDKIETAYFQVTNLGGVSVA